MSCEECAVLEARLNKLEQEFGAKLDGIVQRFLPVSEERLNKLWDSVRETINEFTVKLGHYEESVARQNEKIASVGGAQQQMTQNHMLLSANLNEVTNQLNQVVIQLNGLIKASR